MGKHATIIAFRDEDLEAFEGYVPVTKEELQKIPVWLGPRQYLESFPSMRQLIPYVVIKKGEEILQYRRAIAGNEERLHGKLAVGIGGHVDAEDIWINSEGAVTLYETLEISALREIKEEIGIVVPPESLNILGVIRVSDTPVDEVHVGVAILCDITDLVIGDLTFEDSMDEIKFSSLEDIFDNEVEKETWTTMLRPSLFVDRDLRKMASGEIPHSMGRAFDEMIAQEEAASEASSVTKDDPPELDQEWFDKAQLNHGDDVIRDGSE